MTATTAPPAPAGRTPDPDERVATTSTLARVMKRPESGAVGAALVVFVFFSVATESFLSWGGATAWLEASATVGIMAVAVALLMIGGEFDLSAGAMTGFAGLSVGVMTTQWELTLWLAIAISLVLCLAIGAANGLIVMRTGLPSFIVTLGTFFVLQGINLAVVKLIIGGVAIQGLADVPGLDSARWVFSSLISVGDGGRVYASVVWWVGLTALATWMLLRTRVGNWIFAVGGQQTSARQVGVPVLRVKVGLFMTTAAAGWLVGMLLLFRYTSMQSSQGVGQEFIYIICAVVGGCLLTGGYGSAVGAALGALIYGMTYQGIIFAGWDNNWLRAFLGVMLLLAVLVNTYVRRRAEAAR